MPAMNASKENCRKAREYFIEIVNEADPTLTERRRFIGEFLDAAEKKLPTEDAFKRDKKSKKAKQLAGK